MWAFAPMLDGPALKSFEFNMRSGSEATENESRSIDVRAFAATLWNPPPPPPPLPVPESASAANPPKPLNLQLIGIIEETDGTRRAAVYDIDNDRMLILSGGDSVRDHTVKSITARTIELTDGRSTQRLNLRQEPS